MKLYRTRTREQYDWLMQKLEDEGYKWTSQDKPTEYNEFATFEENTVIRVNKVMDYMDVQIARRSHDDIPIIEVSDLMEVTE